MALTFGCSESIDPPPPPDNSKSDCIKAELEIKANTLNDVAVACGAIKSEVLAQVPNNIGTCNKNDLDFDKTIKDIATECGVAEIPVMSSSSLSVAQSSSSISVTSGTFTDSRDGQTYKWVKIGSQVWMGENLNYNANNSRCYNNEPTNCTIYGRLYDWSTAMDIASTYNSTSYSAWANLQMGENR